MTIIITINIAVKIQPVVSYSIQNKQNVPMKSTAEF